MYCKTDCTKQCNRQVTVKLDAYDFPTTASSNTNNVYISGSTTHGGWEIQ